MLDERKQLNFRAGSDTFEQIEEIRLALRPIPSASEVLREAVRLMHRKVVRASERETNGSTDPDHNGRSLRHSSR